MSVPRARLLDLMKVQCRIFASTYNPEGLRLGNKILRQRLRGPAVAAYYPRKSSTIKELKKIFADQADVEPDEKEYYREEHIVMAKARGKGPPKKKRTAEESKKFKGGKKR